MQGGELNKGGIKTSREGVGGIRELNGGMVKTKGKRCWGGGGG